MIKLRMGKWVIQKGNQNMLLVGGSRWEKLFEGSGGCGEANIKVEFKGII
jgi:hypothetical protein